MISLFSVCSLANLLDGGEELPLRKDVVYVLPKREAEEAYARICKMMGTERFYRIDVMEYPEVWSFRIELYLPDNQSCIEGHTFNILLKQYIKEKQAEVRDDGV